MKKRLLILLALTAGLLLALPAMAQDRQPGVKKAPAAGAPKREEMKVVKVIRGPRGKKTIFLGEVHLEGKIARPSAFYLLQRTPLNSDVTPLERGFTHRIMESVRKTPF